LKKLKLFLERSTSAEIVQSRLDKSLNATFEEDVSDSLDQVDCDLEGLRRFIFAENESLMTKTVTEGIGALKTFISKTSANESSAQGNG